MFLASRLKFAVLLLGLAAAIWSWPRAVRADDLTSASFIVRDPVTASSGNYSASASFQIISSTGQTNIGQEASASFVDCNGVLYYEGATAPALGAAAGDAQVTLNWTAANGVCGNVVTDYSVGVATVSNGPYVYTGVGNVLTYTKTGLTNGTPYYFVIRAISGTTVMATSTEVPATPAAGGGGGGGYTQAYGTLTAPNGGEILDAGSPYQILWSAGGSDVSGIKLSLTTDNGATYPTVITPNAVNSSYYYWTVPDVSTTQAKIKMELLGTSIVDTSDAVFTIVGTAPPPIPPVTPTEPPPVTPAVPPVTPPVTPSAPPACSTDCSKVSYDLYIVNPTGTERHVGSDFVRVMAVDRDTVRHFYEDSGTDMDFNDLVIDVNKADCRHLGIKLVSLNAGWHHQIRLAVYYDGIKKRDTLVWPDSQIAVGQSIVYDAGGTDLCSAASAGSPALRGVEVRVGDLVIGDTSEVFYVGRDGLRHAFYNPKVYSSWYQDFSKVKKVTPQQVSAIPLGPNVTYKPGVRLVKLISDPKVYAVAARSVLRWIADSTVAVMIYGPKWESKLDDLIDSMFPDYTIGQAIDSALGFDPVEVQKVGSIDDNQEFPAVAPGQLPAGVLPADFRGVQPVPDCSVEVVFASFMGYGSTDARVLPLQQLLQCLGFFPADVAATGYFGSTTEQAVRAFQLANGITQTGTVGPNTIKALNNYSVQPLR